MSVEREGSACRIVDFILSCRVMGRRVEEAMVLTAARHAAAQGLGRIVARHLPTAKNKPCLDFWRRSGFAAAEGGLFSWDLGKPYPAPAVIAIECTPHA